MLVTAFIVTLSVLLTVAVPVVPLSGEAQQVARLPRIGLLYTPPITHECRVYRKPSCKACASWAMWMVRTSPLSIDGQRASTTGTPVSRPSWFG